MEALRQQKTEEACRLLGEALAIDGAFQPGWLNLATAYRIDGRHDDALAAVRTALTLDPLSFRALMLRANILEAQGKTRSAAQAYSIALTQQPADSALDEGLRRAAAHGRELYRAFLGDLEGFLRREAPPEPVLGRSAETRRMTDFFGHVLGKRRPYHSEPTNFYYPGLPSIEFYDRDDFPWLPRVEALTPQIRAELEAVLDQPLEDDLEPYMQRPPEEPVQQWGELNQSLKWSAYHFSIYGQHFEAHRRRCPITAAMLDSVGQPDLPNRSPSAMFSILQPKTHIPPHTGAGNVRLLCHLPLIIPPNCRFRVGNSIREWIPGEAMIFDDTIEHEAWNDSDEVRAVLIFDLWHPALSETERHYVTRLLSAIDRFAEE